MQERRDRLAGKASITSDLLLGRSEMLRSLRHSSHIHTSHKTTLKYYKSSKHWGKRSLTNEYMRNPTDTKTVFIITTNYLFTRSVYLIKVIVLMKAVRSIVHNK